MKRFHLHLAVNDLAANITFYTKLFGQSPSQQRQDYAKWMLDNPRLNFAISTAGDVTGINHLGMQAESLQELENLKALAQDASEGGIMDQGEVACCYARSEKHWTIDPQGLAWEHFHTLSDDEVAGDAFGGEFGAFGEEPAKQTDACCIPLHSADKDEDEPCCIPQEVVKNQTECCT